MADLQLPVIHLNGTSKESLLKDIDSAYDALSEAITALSRMGPNMRDYYPLRDAREAFSRAQDQHYGQIQRIQAIQSELESLIEGIEEGGAGRK